MSKPKYFREQQHYSLNQIAQKLGLVQNMEKVEKIVGTLKKYGVVKSVQKIKNGYEDLSDLEVIADVSDDNEDIVCDKNTIWYDDITYYTKNENDKYVADTMLTELEFNQRKNSGIYYYIKSREIKPVEITSLDVDKNEIYYDIIEYMDMYGVV